MNVTENLSDYKSRLEDSLSKWPTRGKIATDDGLLLILLKLMVGPPVNLWHKRVFCNIMPLLSRPSGWIVAKLGESSDPSKQLRVAIDLYKFIMDCIACIFYLIGTLIVFMQITWLPFRLVLVCGVCFCVLRLLELVAVVTYLHSDATYSPKASPRAIFNTLWHYGEVTLYFSVFYLCCLSFFPASIASSNGESLGRSLFGAIHFSFVTITTLGYGDYAPNADNPVTVGLVMLEVMLGFYFLLIVLQKSMTK